MKNQYQFTDKFKRGDFTHRGTEDFYEDKEKEILAAITSRRPFDTGWGGCKHEILSLEIVCDGEGGFSCSVSISDDFDTEGMGTVDLSCDGESPEKTLEVIKQALDEAHGLAVENKKENETYRGFSIHNEQGSWIETYIQPWNGSDFMNKPSGDNYHKWGFQEECDDEMPENVAHKLEDWACSYRDGKLNSFTVEGWTIKPWK